MKRLIDIVGGTVGLLVVSPLLLPLMVLVWWQDWHSPFYVAPRVGRAGRVFQMVKLRSMVVGAASTGVDSTSANDARVTRVGRFIRRFKLDEFPQLWNVVRGDMSLVGPRPNVRREIDLYTAAERCLLDVHPGVTDFGSIVFADLADILKDRADPDIAYNQLVRPGKSMLGIFYVEHQSLRVDLQLVWLTAIALVSRPRALAGIQRLMRKLGASQELLQIASRTTPLVPLPPPGAEHVVTTRNGRPAR